MIQVTYRRTSRLSMRIVKNGDVHVSAPIGMSRQKVMEFIEEHRDWIGEARKKTCERQNQRAAFYNQLPLATRAQADEALRRLKALVEPSHNARFHALMDKYFPRWREARKATAQLLKQ